MTSGLVLLANLLTVTILVATAVLGPMVERAARVAAAAGVPIAMGVLLSIYVFGEDDYRDNGTSRWDAYTSPGGELDEMFVLSLVLLAVCAALIVLGSLTGRRRLLAGAALGGALGSFALVTATILGFTLN